MNNVHQGRLVLTLVLTIYQILDSEEGLFFLESQIHRPQK